MRADGRDRSRLGGYGRPLISPDGRSLLLVSFTNPATLELVELATGQVRPVNLPERKVFSIPAWAGDGTVVAVVGVREGDTIARLDLSDPGRAKIKEVLWDRPDGFDAELLSPVYSVTRRRCAFIGKRQDRSVLYSVQAGRSGSAPAKRLEPGRGADKIVGLCWSPGGRYLLFCSDRPEPPARDLTRFRE
jgi:Tol biopolymer transport system component